MVHSMVIVSLCFIAIFPRRGDGFANHFFGHRLDEMQTKLFTGPP